MLQQFDERNRDLVVNVNGRLSHRDEAGVSPFDSVVQGGDAVWEGLRLYEGRIFALDEHLARLRRSAQALAFAEIPDDEAIVEQIRRTLAANGMTDGVHVRLTLTRGVKTTSGMDPRLNQAGDSDDRHARVIAADDFAPGGADLGKAAPEEFRNNAKGDEGVWEGRSLEGARVMGAYAKSGLSGWRAFVGIPHQIVQQPLRRSLWTLAALGALLFTLSFLLAAWFARRFP